MTGPEPQLGTLAEAGGSPVRATREIALVDLLDRLLAGGVVLTGDITLSLAGVDLVRVSLQALITSVRESEGLTGLVPRVESGDG